ncbi:hypothetical protein VTI28DRAFT_7930 [Corynascus sepedonium]
MVLLFNTTAARANRSSRESAKIKSQRIRFPCRTFIYVQVTSPISHKTPPFNRRPAVAATCRAIGFTTGNDLHNRPPRHLSGNDWRTAVDVH